MEKGKPEIAIPAKFLNHFYDKPPVWWLFWWRLFADISNGGGQVTYSQTALCSWLSVSRSTLRRIVDFGTNFNDGGQLVDSKWTAGSLKISYIGVLKEQLVDTSRTVALESSDIPLKSKQIVKTPVRIDKKERRKSNVVFSKMIEIYNDWMLDYTGFPAKIDGAQGKAMKGIITYLKTAIEKSKNNDGLLEEVEIRVLEGWKLILSNWDNLSHFYQEQTKLTQINSNIQIILTQIKNLKKKPSSDRKDKMDNELNDYLNKISQNAD